MNTKAKTKLKQQPGPTRQGERGARKRGVTNNGRSQSGTHVSRQLTALTQDAFWRHDRTRAMQYYNGSGRHGSPVVLDSDGEDEVQVKQERVHAPAAQPAKPAARDSSTDSSDDDDDEVDKVLRAHSERYRRAHPPGNFRAQLAEVRALAKRKYDEHLARQDDQTPAPALASTNTGDDDDVPGAHDGDDYESLSGSGDADAHNAGSEFDRLLHELSAVQVAAVQSACRDKAGRPLTLDDKQVAAVRAGMDMSNDVVVVCGPAGAGKTLVLKVLLALHKMTQRVTVVAPEWLLLNNLKDVVGEELAQQCEFKTLSAAFGVQMKESGGSEKWVPDQMMRNILSEDRKNALEAYASDVMIGDELGKVDPLALNSGAKKVCEEIRAAKGWATSDRPLRGMRYIFFSDASQCGPIISELDADEVRWRDGCEFFYESSVMDVRKCTIAALMQVHRQGCERMKAVLPKIRVAMSEDAEVIEFFNVADKVEFADSVPRRQIQYGVLSNVSANKKGATVYSNDARMEGRQTWQQHTLVDGNCNPESAKWTWALQSAASKQMMWDPTWAVGDYYRFNAGFDGGENETAARVQFRPDEFVRNKELAELVAIFPDAAELQFRLVNHDDAIVTTRMKRFTVYLPGNGRVQLYCQPWRYARVQPMFGMQGSEFDYLDIDAGGNNFGKNLLYTAVTRGKGSPWEGKLRIKKLKGNGGLEKKLKTHPKSLVWLHKMGEFVPADKLNAAYAQLRHDAKFWQRMAVIDRAHRC